MDEQRHESGAGRKTEKSTFLPFLIALLALIVLVVLFVVIVAATLPAATAYRYAEPHLQPLRLQGIDGSLWNGRATQASVLAPPLG